MFRSTLAVVAGYAVLIAITVPIFALVFVAPDFVFEEDEARATLVFSLLTLAIGFAGAFVGGRVAAKIAGARSRAVVAFAAIVLVLGLALAVANALSESPPERTAEELESMTLEERIESSREPLWYSYVNPLIGAAGVLLGGRRRRDTAG